ncbi:DUF6292 family protein [Actinoplanes aureus]|uniref:DUF6292 domain-containing protein n=1 Tax=Actinoplanes aureus TaxID=2792083 RepID=A0A931CC36_9ACTN|nr:DUF6292 family protein [Actinoplanes aureus]MBG0562165.1 hypothetical protein [Actinoplanes aureus]
MAGHAAYIRAVAEALEAAGVPVADWRADSRVPRDGWIPFDLIRQVRLHGRPVWDHDQAGLGWDEDNGWYLLTVDDPYGRGVRTTTKLAVARLAAPTSVVRAVARHGGIAGPAGPQAHPDLDFPDHRAGRPDAGFEAALLRYAQVAQSPVDASGNAAEGRS